MIRKVMEQRMRLFCTLLLGGLIVFVHPATSQPRLTSSVIGSGASLLSKSPNGSGISSTIGQVVISAQVRSDSTALYQGFWVPYLYGTVGVDDREEQTVAEFGNYPNPFTTHTTIRFATPVEGRLTIRVYNLLGSLVRTVTAEVSMAGSQDVMLQAVDDYGVPMPAGTYVYEVEGTTVSGVPFRKSQTLTIIR
ncbi:MAG: T9SS type A sorting domain-containing protein [Candidatus Kapabacteria bacterium]|nr:T9SS type A sorting domain-containing protein [Candidatus Kapabacteria bacterium]